MPTIVDSAFKFKSPALCEMLCCESFCEMMFTMPTMLIEMKLDDVKKIKKIQRMLGPLDFNIGRIQTLFLWILKSLNFGISTISSDSQ